MKSIANGMDHVRRIHTVKDYMGLNAQIIVKNAYLKK